MISLKDERGTWDQEGNLEKSVLEEIQLYLQYVNKKKSDLSPLEMANDVNEFNDMTLNNKPYTEEEFNLLKEYFKC